MQPFTHTTEQVQLPLFEAFLAQPVLPGLKASELAASRVTGGTASIPARRASAWNAPLCKEITITTQANGVMGLALPRLWLSSMFSTRKAQYS